MMRGGWTSARVALVGVALYLSSNVKSKGSMLRTAATAAETFGVMTRQSGISTTAWSVFANRPSALPSATSFTRTR